MTTVLTDYSYEQDRLYVEYNTMDMTETIQTRKFYSLDDVFTKVGGVLHVIKIVSALIFCHYSKQSYNVDSINHLIQISNENLKC